MGVEVETGVGGRTGNAYLARAADFERQSSIDPALFPALFARRTEAYLRRYPRRLHGRPGGHNYIGHNYIGHNYIGHNYTGHTYIGTRPLPWTTWQP